MNNPDIIVKFITEKSDFLKSIEKPYLKVQEMLHYLGIKPPSRSNFNHYLELIKQRKQDLAFARWMIQRQHRECFMSHMRKTELIKMYKNKEQMKKVYKTAIAEEGARSEEGPPRKIFSGIYTRQNIQLNKNGGNANYTRYIVIQYGSLVKIGYGCKYSIRLGV